MTAVGVARVAYASFVSPAGNGHCNPFPVSAQEVELLSTGTSAAGIVPLRLAPLMDKEASLRKLLLAKASKVPVNGVLLMDTLCTEAGSVGSVPLSAQDCICRLKRLG